MWVVGGGSEGDMGKTTGRGNPERPKRPDSQAQGGLCGDDNWLLVVACWFLVGGCGNGWGLIDDEGAGVGVRINHEREGTNKR